MCLFNLCLIFIFISKKIFSLIKTCKKEEEVESANLVNALQFAFNDTKTLMLIWLYVCIRGWILWRDFKYDIDRSLSLKEGRNGTKTKAKSTWRKIQNCAIFNCSGVASQVKFKTCKWENSTGKTNSEFKDQLPVMVFHFISNAKWNKFAKMFYV